MNTLSLTNRLEVDSMPPGEAAEIVVRVAERVAAWHRQGILHRALTPEAISLGSSAEDIEVAEPAAEAVMFGGAIWDAEQAPVEFSSASSLSIPRDLTEARQVLESARINLDPCQLDLYQLGVLLNRLLTGETVTGYLSSPKVKSRVPEAWRGMLEQSLGYSHNGRLKSADDLIAVLRSNQSPTQLIGETSPAPHAPSTADQPLPFHRIGDYEIRGRIGHGGMGDVYLGHDVRLNRTVAVKVLPDELARHTDFVRRFYAEAASAARLVHPNIIEILNVGEDQGRHFFVMEYVAGESLAERLTRQKFLSVEEAVSITQQILSALTAAHQEGFIHRDIKPGNILLESTPRRAVLADFGLVKSLQEATGMTATGVVIGTVHYLSPEQARGRPVDERSDLYSLGVLLYQMLSGELPFTGEGTTALIYQHVYEPPRPLIEVAPMISPVLGVIVDKLLAKLPEERYASAALLAADLHAFMDGEPLPSGVDIVESEDGESPAEDSLPPDATVIIAAPKFDQPPVFSLPEPHPPELPAQPVDGNWWLRLQQQLWAKVQEYAPEFAASLQTTEQRLDSTVSDFEHKQSSLQTLTRKALRLLQELRQRRADWQAAAERSDSDDERQRCQQNLTELAQQIVQQQEQLSEMRLQQAKVSAALERMRSQKDVLLARIKVVDASLKLSGWKRRRQIMRSFAVLVAMLVVIAAIWIASDGSMILSNLTGWTSKFSKTLRQATIGVMPIGMPKETLDPPQQKLRDVNSAVTAIAFSSDGRQLFVGMEHSPLGAWNLETGKREIDRKIRENQESESFRSLAVHPAAKWVISTHQPGLQRISLRVWQHDLRTDPQEHSIPGLEGVFLTPDPREVLLLYKPESQAKSAKLDLYDLPSNTILRTVSDNVAMVHVAGDLAAYTSKDDGSLHVWSLPKKSELRVIPDVTTGLSYSKFKLSDNGQWAAFSHWETHANTHVTIWNLTTGKKISTHAIRGRYVTDIAFQPGTNNLAVASENLIELWDLSSQRVRKLLQADSVRQIAFSPDGSQLAAFGGDGLNPLVVLWDAAPGVLTTTGNVRTLPGQGPAALSADGVQYVSVEQQDLVLRNLADERIVQRIDTNFGTIKTVALSPNAAYAAVTAQIGNRSDRAHVQLLDLRTGLMAKQLEGQNQLVFSPDSQFLYFANETDLLRYEFSTGEQSVLADNIMAPCVIMSMDVSPGHDQLAICGTISGNYQRFLIQVDLEHPTAARRPPGDAERWDVVRYLPDGNTLAVLTSYAVVFYNSRSFSELRRFPMGTRIISKAIDFTSDGSNFALAFNQLGLHAMSTGTMQRLFQPYKDAKVTASYLRFTPDERHLFSVENGQSVLLFDTTAISDPVARPVAIQP